MKYTLLAIVLLAIITSTLAFRAKTMSKFMAQTKQGGCGENQAAIDYFCGGATFASPTASACCAALQNVDSSCQAYGCGIMQQGYEDLKIYCRDNFGVDCYQY